MEIKDRIKELRRVRAADLIPHPRNWRLHPEGQQSAVRGALNEIGYADALIAREAEDGSLELIDGHLRRDLTPEQEVPVLVTDLSSEEADKLLATLDPLASLAETDAGALADLIGSLEFESGDLSRMVAGLAGTEATAEGEVVEDDVPEAPTDPRASVGDVWVMGEHRLLCGDSTDARHLGLLMGDDRADTVLTDPPYGVAYTGKTKDALTIQNDDLSEQDLAALVTAAFDLAERYSRPGAYWYATVPAGPLHLVFANDWHRRGILRQVLVWVKDSLVLGRSEYHYRHEPILFGWVPGGTRRENSDRTRTSVWECDRPKKSAEHPTMKPVELWARAIRDSTAPGEIVLDPFCGSGTTIVAAEQMGRRARAIELDPRYCDVIVARWEALTGRSAKVIS